MPDPSLRPATIAVTSGRPDHVPDAPLNHPITMAATYVAGGDLEYGRYGNPTWAAFEDLGALEGGRCLSFATGLSAVATILDLVAQGQTVVAPRHAYNGTVMQLADLEARGRLTARLVDITNTDEVIAACADASLVWLESPTNPALEVADIPAIREAAQAAGAYVVVDNTFATPLLQQPLSMGVDLVVHSATKFLSGTPTYSSARSSPATTTSSAYSRTGGTSSVRSPARSRPGWPCAACAPSTCASSGRSRTPRSSYADSGSTQRSARSATPASAGSSRSCSPRARWPPTCSPTRPACGCTPRRSAASSRRSSAGVAGRPNRPPSRTGWSGSPSASRTSRTSGADLRAGAGRPALTVSRSRPSCHAR